MQMTGMLNSTNRKAIISFVKTRMTVEIVGAAAPVPEPATLILLGSGLAGLAFYRRKRK
ncbi:MAG: hypothetical protein DRP47_07815 [Candidatus Zixiibacteriota bacterium]|nr:MAG: hypothetical protein DRP47_07815 [candidate division Zixibacteria bacterium]